MGGWWLTAIGTLITGACYCLKQYTHYKGLRLPFQLGYYNDSVAYYFRTLVFVLIMRSFVVEWSIIPSEANKPTLLTGDRILVDKAAYGIRLPITGQLLIPSFSIRLPIIGHFLIPSFNPKRADMIAFRYPYDASRNTISRVIGVPGDTIEYNSYVISLNGQNIRHESEGTVEVPEANEEVEKCFLTREYLNENSYQIYTNFPKQSNRKTHLVTVPKGYYFVMGDNRDQSSDSRSWGCVPEYYILGKAKRIYLSRAKPMILWKPHTWIRWNRLGMRVK